MESIIFNSKKYIGRKQIVLDCKFSIDSSSVVEKVLSIQAKPIILNSRCEDGKVIFGGKLDTTFIYIAQNGQKMCLVNVSEFSQSFENSAIQSGDDACLECKVVDITTPSVKTNEVKVACIIDVSVSVIKNKEVCTQINCDQEQIQSQDIIIMALKEKLNGSFDLIEEIKIDGGVNKVLKVDAHACVRDAICNAGFIALDMCVSVNTIYVDDFDNIAVNKHTFDVRQEVECNSSNLDSSCCIKVVPLNYLIKSIVTQGDGFNTIKVQIPMQYNGEVYANTCESVVQDAYSLSQITKVEKCEEEYICACKNAYYEATCTGEVDAYDDGAEVVCVLDVSAEVTNHILNGERLDAEGVISATVLCKKTENSVDENGEERQEVVLQPVRADFAFATSFSAGEIAGCDDVVLFCDVLDANSLVGGGKLNTTIKLGVWVHAQMQNVCSVVKSVVAESERSPKECAMEIFVNNEDQDLWELCKQAGLERQEVLKQNPQLESTVEKGAKIFVYYPIKIQNK